MTKQFFELESNSLETLSANMQSLLSSKKHPGNTAGVRVTTDPKHPPGGQVHGMSPALTVDPNGLPFIFFFDLDHTVRLTCSLCAQMKAQLHRVSVARAQIFALLISSALPNRLQGK